MDSTWRRTCGKHVEENAWKARGEHVDSTWNRTRGQHVEENASTACGGERVDSTWRRTHGQIHIKEQGQ